MRAQTRPDPPQVFASNQTKWTNQWLELCATNEKGGVSAKFAWYRAEGKSAREWALPQLKTMNQSHCSFCDGYPIDSVTKESIEHFRPKSKFPELAYSWGNLYYCCDKCQNKGERWSDDPIPLSPDEDGYSCNRYFEFDWSTGRMSPNSTASLKDQARARLTIDLYGLDSPTRRLRRREMLRLWEKSVEPMLDDFPYRDFIEMRD